MVRQGFNAIIQVRESAVADGQTGWLTLGMARDATLNSTYTEADATSRSSGGATMTEPTLMAASIDVECLQDDDSAALALVRAAIEGRLTLGVRVLDAALGNGLEANCAVFKKDESQALADLVKHGFTLKPRYHATRLPRWVEGYGAGFIQPSAVDNAATIVDEPWVDPEQALDVDGDFATVAVLVSEASRAIEYTVDATDTAGKTRAFLRVLCKVATPAIGSTITFSSDIGTAAAITPTDTLAWHEVEITLDPAGLAAIEAGTVFTLTGLAGGTGGNTFSIDHAEISLV